MTQQNNDRCRPAGTGIIKAGTKPDKRGVWDLYETTNPRIGLFDVSLWIERNDDLSHKNEDALKEIAIFVRDNIKENIIMLEFNHKRIMGGYGSGEKAGRTYLEGDHDILDFSEGYEIRLMHSDAVTFMTLWHGYENINS